MQFRALYLYYFDFYRFADPSEWETAGLADLFRNDRRVPGRVAGARGGLLPAADLELTLAHAAPDAQSVATSRCRRRPRQVSDARPRSRTSRPARALIGISWQRPAAASGCVLAAARLAVSAASAQAASRVASARVCRAGIHARDRRSNTPLPHQLSVLRNPDRLVLDIDGIDASSQLAELPARVHPTDPYIAAIRLGAQLPNVMRIVLDLEVRGASPTCSR